MDRASNLLSRKAHTAPGACCCTTGTLVWTSAGLTPIEQIRVGELVLTRHHESGEIGWYPVTGLIETPQSALLVLTLRHEGGHLQVVETTDEHPYRVGESWTRADELSVGSVVGTFDGEAVVESIQLGGRREPVYNITVGGAHSYLVGYEMVWVHNCFGLPKTVLPGTALWAAAERAALDGKTLRIFGDFDEMATHLIRNGSRRNADELSQALYRLKDDIPGNPDVILHSSGDVYAPTGDHLGNLLVD